MFLKIPVILPAGKEERWVEDVKNGIEMAFANSHVQLKTLPAYYLVYNNHQTIVENLNGESPIVIAAVSTEDYGTLKSHMNDKKFILFTPTASQKDLLNGCNKCFRNVPSNEEEAKYMADFLRIEQEVTGNHIVIFKTDTKEYSINFSALLATKIPNVTEVSRIEEITNDKKWVILIGEKKWKKIEQILRTKKKKGISILTTSSIEDWRQPKERLELVKDSMFFTYPNSGGSRTNFSQDFNNEFGYNPSVFSALGFDAVNIAIKAITKGGHDYRSVKKVLLKEVFDDCVIGGTVCFDDNGEIIISGTIKEHFKGEFIIKTIGKDGQYINLNLL